MMAAGFLHREQAQRGRLDVAQDGPSAWASALRRMCRARWREESCVALKVAV